MTFDFYNKKGLISPDRLKKSDRSIVASSGRC